MDEEEQIEFKRLSKSFRIAFWEGHIILKAGNGYPHIKLLLTSQEALNLYSYLDSVFEMLLSAHEEKCPSEFDEFFKQNFNDLLA